MMKRHFPGFIALITIVSLAGCSEPQVETNQQASNQEPVVSIDPTMTYDRLEAATHKPDATITKEGDWTVVTRVEKDKRVYWFVAPDADKVSPALFKKTVQINDHSKETLTVSKCEAPKKTCDDLMEQFKTMSEKYK